MKKRIIAILVCAVMMLQLTGCQAAHSEAADEELRYQDDYYEYVNEELLDLIELEETDAQWTWYGELSAGINSDMREIIAEVCSSGEKYEKGSSEQKIRDLYACISDMENRNKTGLGPLQPHLDTIRNAGTIDEYVDALAKLSGEFGFSSLVGGYYVSQDKIDSNKNAVYMTYADTLIGKEYLEDSQMQEYVTMYYDYMTDMFVEFGMSESKAELTTQQIDGLLREICAESLSLEQYYDPSITYNVFTKEELQELYTNIDIDQMLKTLRIDGVDTYIVLDVQQAKKVNSLLVEENLELLKNFSTFVMLNDVAEYSTAAYAKLSEDIENKMYGVTASYSDEFIWMNMTQDMLAWDFGKIYVEDNFSPESKKYLEAMIELIIQEYEELISRQTWMSEETKQKAIRKLETMGVKIGYPDEWPESMERFQVTSMEEGGSLLSNLLENMRVSIDVTLDTLGDDVDKSEWSMTPQSINAYYAPSNNEIVFPAGILQAPFYDEKFSDARNLGAIGYVIAHEISHAFDASGALYDENGNYNMWWTQEEIAAYDKLSQSIVDYYSKYKIAGIPVDGELTLSENIADLGAMTCITSIIGDDSGALNQAFQQMAYIWASEATIGYEMYLLRSDTHAPNKVRVNAVLSSCDAFYEVYGIEESDGMYVAPDLRVGIWK